MIHMLTISTKKPSAYGSWVNMRQRCSNPRAHGYENYGGRGIKICPRWRSFADFYADMGERPAGFTIERLDVNGDYEPANCTWISKSAQGRNRRSTVFYQYEGRTRTLAELAAEHGLGARTVRTRLVQLRWTLKDALKTPLARSVSA